VRGLVLGKFLPYHNGHAHLIREARSRVDELTVLVCSIRREPIPGALRYRWVRDAHPDCRVMHVAEEVPQAPDEDPAFWAIWSELIERHAGAVDVVLTSESYGDELAARLGARHVCVDAARAVVPISGTAIRDSPMANWRFLPRQVRPYFARRVALLGAESTGKSTLSEKLAHHFETVWVPEYGRPYCEIIRPALELDLGDLEAIAWGQATWEDEYAAQANRVLICDTDLHTTATWGDLLLGVRPPWLDAAARARRYDLVLLLTPEVPWQDDGTRVLRDRRVEHTELLRRELDAAGREYHVLAGSYAEREARAVELVKSLIG
jgi:HTH-type transcriptional repressor of NAD biosynthesis genes